MLLIDSALQKLGSSRPFLTLIKNQEPEEILPRYWPTDLKLLGIHEGEKSFIDRHVKEAYQAGHIRCDKRKFTYFNDTRSIQVSVEFPLSSTLLKVDGVFHIILLPKTVFLSGGERRIKWAYNLITGEFLLKKRIVGMYEKRLILELQENRLSRNLIHSLFFRKVPQSGTLKEQIIETVRDGIVPLILGNDLLSDCETKKDLIVDLLSDLKTIHQQKITNLKVEYESLINPDEIEVENSPPFLAFHHDITLGNTLVSYHNGKWRAELCDLGASAANPTLFSFTVGFTPPEYIQLYSRLRPKGLKHPSYLEDQRALVNFNLEHAQGRDIWSMGLVLLSILMDRSENITESTDQLHHRLDISPLQSIKNAIVDSSSGPYREIGILSITQEIIDEELDQCKQMVKKMHVQQEVLVESLFKVVSGMLRVNTQERLKMDEISVV